MTKKPHEGIRAGNGQKGVYKCKECGKIWMDTPKGVNRKEFCSKECKKHFEAKQKPDIDNSPLKGSKIL